MQISTMIAQQKDFLSKALKDNVAQLAKQSANTINQAEQLNQLLFAYMKTCNYTQWSYVLNHNGVQLSGNISIDKILTNFEGQDLSARPFFNTVTVERPFYLSDAYISGVTLKPCISVVHAICNDDKLIGMLVLDLDLEKISLPNPEFDLENWRQIKGDPEIRANLFNQVRVESAMDKEINTVHNIAIELLCELGVFHLKLHYASSRATVWTYDDPYNYHVHVLDEVISPNVCLLYPHQPYPKNASVTPEQVKAVFDNFKTMRFSDNQMYLKTGSLNIINGTVGLSFSCDGNHYLNVGDFLNNFEKKYK